MLALLQEKKTHAFARSTSDLHTCTTEVILCIIEVYLCVGSIIIKTLQNMFTWYKIGISQSTCDCVWRARKFALNVCFHIVHILAVCMCVYLYTSQRTCTPQKKLQFKFISHDVDAKISQCEI